MKMKITLEGDLEEMKDRFEILQDLFPFEDTPEVITEPDNPNVKRTIQWRGIRAGCKSFRNDQTITQFEDRAGVLVIHYEMAREEGLQREFRVPKDNMPFIQEAVEAGILAEGRLLWVTIESDKNKRNKWIKLEER